MTKITIEEFEEIARTKLPFSQSMGLKLEQMSDECVLMRAVYREEFLRPGGTVSGPVMMGLADAAMYAMVLARIGPVELAVTTNLNINFLRKPLPGDLLARARPIKIGKRLAIGEISIFSASDDENEMVAHATATYSIPPVNGPRENQ